MSTVIGHIYCVVCNRNQRMYFGQTMQQVESRFEAHIRRAKRGSLLKFHRAMRKYGEENFTVEEVVAVSAPTKKELKAKLDFLERHFIQRYDTRKNGYNMTDGGDSCPMVGKNHSEETKLKIGMATKGRKHLKATKDKISKGNKGKKLSEETRRKISEAKKGKTSPFKGKHLSKEVRKHLSELAIGRQSPFKGHHHSEATKRKMSEIKIIQNHGNISTF